MGESIDSVVLLSGGLDSAVCLAMARAQGLRCATLSFDYGQRHRVELRAARNIADALGAVRQVVLPIDLRCMGGSALTDDLDVPKDSDVAAIEAAAAGAEIPVTYVPGRNLVFLSCGVALAEAIGAREVSIGVNALDYSGYPDCRPDFIDAFSKAAALATRVGVEGHAVEIRTPLLEMRKSEIIRAGADLGVDFSLTHSCYDPDASGLACGHCDSCVLRKRGFASARIADPTRYRGE